MNATVILSRHWKSLVVIVAVLLGIAYWFWPRHSAPVFGINIEARLIQFLGCDLNPPPIALAEPSRWIDKKLRVVVDAPMSCFSSFQVASPSFAQDGTRVRVHWEWQYPRDAAVAACGKCKFRLQFLLSGLETRDYEIIVPKHVPENPQ